MRTLSPVPVQACWNGIVAFDAAPFYSEPATPALKFRGIPDSLATHHLEASECCLIHADNPLSTQNGVYLNPNVRVAYNPTSWLATHPEKGQWPSRYEKVVGTWANRRNRWTGWLGRYMAKRLVQKMIESWEGDVGLGEERHKEVGNACVIDEMQILIWNGWKHV